MKLFYFLLVLAFLGFAGCKKNTNAEDFNLGVEKYIELLKANRYDSTNLPAFTASDISALLKYRNKTQIITKFPRNTISSLYMPECRLGRYVLCTIESIRAAAIKSKSLIMRFPSQNAILTLKTSPELSLVNTVESHQIAAKAYCDWWNNNQGKTFEYFMLIDPLQNTPYFWH